MKYGPRIRQLTKLSQQDKKRFELEWVLPLEPGLQTHVMLTTLKDSRRRSWPADTVPTKPRHSWTCGRRSVVNRVSRPDRRRG
jgi:hypothetical protein